MNNYYEKHKEEIKAYQRKYYQEHKEQIQKRFREYRAKNYKHFQAYSQNYYRQHKKQMCEYSRKYWKENFSCNGERLQNYAKSYEVYNEKGELIKTAETLKELSAFMGYAKSTIDIHLRTGRVLDGCTIKRIF